MRHRIVVNVQTRKVETVPYTAQEEVEAEALFLAYERVRPLREAEMLHGDQFSSRSLRDIMIGSLLATHPWRVKAEQVEEKIVALGVRNA